MPIYQTNIFMCEVCGKVSSYTKEVEMYDDPVVNLPEEESWEYPPSKPNILHCPECLKKNTEIKE